MSGAVLIVDDDAAIRTVIAQALRREGHRVTAAASLREMQSELAAGVPDVLVTDVMLPDGNGLDAIRDVHAAHPALPVIVLSALAPFFTRAARRISGVIVATRRCMNSSPTHRGILPMSFA